MPHKNMILQPRTLCPHRPAKVAYLLRLQAEPLPVTVEGKARRARSLQSKVEFVIAAGADYNSAYWETF
jgi:hypothetical protein